MLTYSFDALNRLDTVVDTTSAPNVTLADYDWDLLSRRDLVKFDNAAFTSDPAYESDDDLSSLAHTGPSPLSFTIGRNHSSQITSLGASDGAFLARPATTASSAYVPNRLNQYSTVAGVAQTYDINGNLTSDGIYTFEYDEENRLRSAIGNGSNATYEYDPLGRRRAKLVTGTYAGTTRFVSDGAEEIEERDGSNVVLRKYVYGAGVDDRIAMIDAACVGGSRCFYLTNWQGSATTLVNQDGTLNATYHYGPFGEGTNWTPNDAFTGNPFRYTGRRVDPETGLYYYRTRYYSPKTGRFLQADPIGAKDDLNLYAYVGSDAINKTDPSGTCRATNETDCEIRTGSRIPYVVPNSDSKSQTIENATETVGDANDKLGNIVSANETATATADLAGKKAENLAATKVVKATTKVLGPLNELGTAAKITMQLSNGDVDGAKLTATTEAVNKSIAFTVTAAAEFFSAGATTPAAPAIYAGTSFATGATGLDEAAAKNILKPRPEPTGCGSAACFFKQIFSGPPFGPQR